MIIPSIDLVDGQAVQLIGGKEHALDAGDPIPIAKRFRVAGEIAVVDLDAALGQGNNRAVIEHLCRVARCRVGGGIRSLEVARRWLDAGAAKIVLGTAADPELLRELPRERTIAALDAIDGEVVVDGWRTRTGRRIEERMHELRDLVGGFLVTFVEREGRMAGTRLGAVADLVAAAGDARLTIAGGITTLDEVSELDRLGADAQVGMALYTGRLDLGASLAAVLDPARASTVVDDRGELEALWPTVVVDPQGRALGQVWSSRESIRRAVAQRRGIYRSRSRGLWVKGATSGAVQTLERVDVDCDRDSLRFTVTQAPPGFCHEATHSCWGTLGGLGSLEQRLTKRAVDKPNGSLTTKLLGDPALLRAKLLEEAEELAEASARDDVVWEAADVIYFAMVAMRRAGVSLAEVEAELDRRALRISRRGSS